MSSLYARCSGLAGQFLFYSASNGLQRLYSTCCLCCKAIHCVHWYCSPRLGICASMMAHLLVTKESSSSASGTPGSHSQARVCVCARARARVRARVRVRACVCGMQMLVGAYHMACIRPAALFELDTPQCALHKLKMVPRPTCNFQGETVPCNLYIVTSVTGTMRNALFKDL